ncbi:type 4a pilus biogenesis protein PilO [Haliovirga abyssi]|uniref:Pilus assembly protein PilO n=1 Tax=Haliovirga abyssi TaxID=2996794 RepID=A0AAU9DY46_9FUSO|nr:type 4a pilus biogenesis protein PilO [Haliovirga abyssi]BDU51436.1 hypothetical protein HLVA_20050 [Haliovirga abyssi]
MLKKIKNKFSKLSKDDKEKGALIIVGYMILISFSYNFIFKNDIENIAINKKKLLNYKFEYAKSVGKMSKLKDKKAEIENKTKEYNNLKKVYINSSEKQFLRNEIIQKGKDWKIQFKTVDFMEENGKFYKKFVIKLNISSSYSNLLNYLNSLNNLSKKLIIDNIIVKKNSKLVNSTITIHTIIMQKGDKNGE